MSDSRGMSSSVRRLVGYLLAALATGALSLVVYLLAGYLARPAGGHNVSRCVGVGLPIWVGPVLIVVVVGGLAFYLGRIGGGSDEGAGGTVEARCLSCGHGINSEWKICPHCGGLSGRTRHAEDAPDE